MFIFEHPEGVAEFFDEPVELGGVDPFDLFHELERHAEFFGDCDEGFYVLGEAGTAIAETCVEEVSPDPAIHADAVGDHFDISATGFADG